MYKKRSGTQNAELESYIHLPHYLIFLGTFNVNILTSYHYERNKLKHNSTYNNINRKRISSFVGIHLTPAGQIFTSMRSCFHLMLPSWPSFFIPLSSPLHKASVPPLYLDIWIKWTLYFLPPGTCLSNHLSPLQQPLLFSTIREGCRIYGFNSVLQTVAGPTAQHAKEYHLVTVVTVSAEACMCTCGVVQYRMRVYYHWYWTDGRRTHQHTSSDLQ